MISAKTRQRASCPARDWARAAAYLILLASVCFSPGEGLRLLPYAGSAPEEVINLAPAARVNLLRAAAPAQYAYGLEASAQKLATQRAGAGWPLVAVNSAAVRSSVLRLRPSLDLEVIAGYRSHLCASPMAGRAPPLA